MTVWLAVRACGEAVAAIAPLAVATMRARYLGCYAEVNKSSGRWSRRVSHDKLVAGPDIADRG
jgi:hypothetical protein